MDIFWRPRKKTNKVKNIQNYFMCILYKFHFNVVTMNKRPVSVLHKSYVSSGCADMISTSGKCMAACLHVNLYKCNLWKCKRENSCIGEFELVLGLHCRQSLGVGEAGLTYLQQALSTEVTAVWSASNMRVKSVSSGSSINVCRRQGIKSWERKEAKTLKIYV